MRQKVLLVETNHERLNRRSILYLEALQKLLLRNLPVVLHLRESPNPEIPRCASPARRRGRVVRNTFAPPILGWVPFTYLFL
jgi:hypothetical protein